MKVLFFGAGVLGSLYAARLHEAGTDVTLVARGTRYEELQEHGVVLVHFDTGERTQTAVRVVDQMPVDESYDLCVVLIQKTQLDAALPVLAQNPHIPTFLFMHNTAEGPRSLIEAVGKKRVMLGHVNAGGERDGHIVQYMEAESMTLGELDGSKSERLLEIAATFEAAGFPVSLSGNIEAWKRYHVALVGPFANALYMAGTDNYRLAGSREGVRKGIRGIREAIRVLQANGFPIEPAKLRLITMIPVFILTPLFQRLLGTKLMDIGGARHARNARDEMRQLNEELFALAERVEMETPTLRELHRYSDPSVPPAITD